MAIDLVVLDFDGTFTDSEVEGAPFAAIFPIYLREAANADEQLHALWPAAMAAVTRESPELGWMMNGVAAAPADADPYVRCSMAAHKVLDQLGLYLDGADRSGLLQQVYKRAYAESVISFRPGAAEALQAVLDRGVPVVVVTNSSTSHVRFKVDQLGLRDAASVEVIGDAMKFWVDPAPQGAAEFDGLPERRFISGLQRPVYLHRNKYYETLRKLWAKHGASAATTLVCGDIFELDLALPAALGSKVVLMRRANTYSFELQAVAEAGARGAITDDLAILASLLDG